MKKELYTKPKVVTAVYFDGTIGSFLIIQTIAPKAVYNNVEVSENTTQVRVILNGDMSDKYDNILYPGQWVIAKTYTRSKYHKDDQPEEVWFEILDNLDEYIEASKVIITE